MFRTRTLLLFTTLTFLLSIPVLSSPSTFSSFIMAAPSTQDSSLAQAALNEILTRGAPILGADIDEGVGSLTEWMASVPGETKLVQMNLPGTHDTSTWNYTAETQASLERYTGPLPDSTFYRCQEHSLFQMINEGIRVFDLRYAYNPGNDTIGLHHAQALLAPTTSLSDVFFGLYTWLSKHPSETLLISLNHESGTGTPSDAKLQEMIYNLFEGDLGRELLLQRFDYDMLPATPEYAQRIGIHLGPQAWTDNGPDIEIVYNEKGEKAYIEDFYAIPPPDDGTTESFIRTKFNATTAHLALASSPGADKDGLYISFASAAWVSGTDVTPQVFALGNGTDTPGMNQLLLQWFKEQKPGRFGVVMLDFYDAVPGLVGAVIEVNGNGTKGKL
ncbi:PLC-like phosphodiesterase [Cyathus striatus]|nr:PLC-like phosphodiesterase [Cyathus striatus]